MEPLYRMDILQCSGIIHNIPWIPQIPFFIILWKSMEYDGISWTFLRILHPDNKTRANILPVRHTVIFLDISQRSMEFEPNIPYLRRIWHPYHIKGPIDNGLYMHVE